MNFILAVMGAVSLVCFFVAPIFIVIYFIKYLMATEQGKKQRAIKNLTRWGIAIGISFIVVILIGVLSAILNFMVRGMTGL